MRNEIIDAKFRVIRESRTAFRSEARPAPVWSFWGDTVPGLIGVIASTLIAFTVRQWINGAFH